MPLEPTYSGVYIGGPMDGESFTLRGVSDVPPGLVLMIETHSGGRTIRLRPPMRPEEVSQPGSRGPVAIYRNRGGGAWDHSETGIKSGSKHAGPPSSS